MPCTVCGKVGHNARSCPNKNTVTLKNDRQALWIKFDDLSTKEADDLLIAAIEAKSKIAPDARATFAKGKQSELPKKITEALMIQSDNNKENE